eukprot:7828582-Prorocentrum_lima.AAC.1
MGLLAKHGVRSLATTKLGVGDPRRVPECGTFALGRGREQHPGTRPRKLSHPCSSTESKFVQSQLGVMRC